MSFVLSQLIVESVIREGFTALRKKPEVLDEIFSDLAQPWLAKKYGQKEINKIKNLFVNNEVSIVHSFNLVPSNLPCCSIQLLDNPEDETKAHLEDFENDQTTPMTDPNDLAKTVKATNVIVTAYDAKSGICSVADATDLTNVRRGLLFFDASKVAFKITGGINNLTGQKQFIIGKNETLDLSSPGQIQSSVNYIQTEQKGVVEKERLILGIHTKEPLVTVYLYQVIKFILNSRKLDLINRGYQLPTYSGSDFTKNLNYPGDYITSRFLTITGTIQNQWTGDQVIPVDVTDVIVEVARDVATNADLGKQNDTVQVDDEQQ